MAMAINCGVGPFHHPARHGGSPEAAQLPLDQTSCKAGVARVAQGGGSWERSRECFETNGSASQIKVGDIRDKLGTWQFIMDSW